MSFILIQYRLKDLDCDEPQKKMLAMLPPSIIKELYDDSDNYYDVLSILKTKENIVRIMDDILCKQPNPLCDRMHIVYASDDELDTMSWVIPSLTVLRDLDYDLEISGGHEDNISCTLNKDIVHPVTLKRKTFLSSGVSIIMDHQLRVNYFVLTKKIRDEIESKNIKGLQYFEVDLNRRLQDLLPKDEHPVLAKAVTDVFEYSDNISSLKIVCKKDSMIGLGGAHSTDLRLRHQDIPNNIDIFNLAGVYNLNSKYYYRTTFCLFSQRFMRLLFDAKVKLSPVQKKPVKSHFTAWYISQD